LVVNHFTFLYGDLSLLLIAARGMLDLEEG
jgi:hypothetical protein